MKQKQCRQLAIQIGRGEFEPKIDDDQISLTFFRLKDSIENDIEDADLVISHAGAGTCLDVLEKKKPLITVINDDLMHNHQTELADKLSEDRYCVSCTCSTLADAIQTINPAKLNPFTNNNDQKCASLIEKFIFYEKVS